MPDFSTADTIVAIATPPGHGGLGVVRLSGPAAAGIARAMVRREDPWVPRHATFARVIAPGAGPARSDELPAAPPPRAIVDHVVVTWFEAPHSYTGDDVVEI